MRVYHYGFSSLSVQLHFTINQEKIKKLYRALNEKKIPYFPIKGDAIAEYYPVPALRTMGDVDIMIKENDRQKVHDLMLDLGYQNSTQGVTVWNYNLNGLEIEIHTKLINSISRCDEHLEKYFEQCWQYVQNEKLNWNYHFIYLLAHLRKHFMNSGVGFRQFMDLAVLIQSNKELDWEWIEQQLNEVHIFEFSKICFAFINRWFGIMAPLSMEILDEEFYESSTTEVFENGVFGFNNKKNKYATVVNQVRAGKNKFAIAISMIFPPYTMLKSLPSYSFLRGKPFLLPVAWLYRIKWGIKYKKTGKAIDYIKKSLVDADAIKARSEVLDQWRL